MLRDSILLDCSPTALAYYRKALNCAINTKKLKTEKQKINKVYKWNCTLHRNRIPITNIKTNTDTCLLLSALAVLTERPNLTVQMEQPLIN
jgi:hypothetical protein